MEEQLELELVDERGKVYGTFEGTAMTSQRFKTLLEEELILRRKVLAPDQHEALELIITKLARIINGNSDYADNWKDIAGYATLVADRLEGNPR